MTGTVHVVLPGDIDDGRMASGGNTYDRRVCQGLAGTGWLVKEIRVRGDWPDPGATARSALGQALSAIPDGAVVLMDGLVACGVPEVVVPQARRVRLAVLVHLPLADETGLSAAAAADLDAREREALHASEAVVATSPWAGQRLLARHELDQSRIHVVTPGTDPAPLAPGTDGASRLVCVAALTPRKGQDVLMEAFGTIRDLSWTCVCVGSWHRDPAYVARIKELIRQFGLDDRVTLAGPRTGDELAAIYATADLVVLASHVETYGMVITEALARGIPVLAASGGAVPETLGLAPDGSMPGLLVPPRDPGALAHALRRWLSAPELRDRLKISARHRSGMLGRWEETSRTMAAVLELLRCR